VNCSIDFAIADFMPLGIIRGRLAKLGISLIMDKNVKRSKELISST